MANTQQVNQVDNVPQDKIGEGFAWRDWFGKVGAYIQAQQKTFSPPIYTTTEAPPAAASSSPPITGAVPGQMYFDKTLGKFKVCEVAGTWKTITTV